jgi:hypothetical protein
MSSYRYRSADLPYGVTREAISWLGPAKQRGVIVAWIEEQFELRNSDHILFGESDTFDVFEIVWDEFDGIVPRDVVESALAEAAGEGEWVSKSTPRRTIVERYDEGRLTELLSQARQNRSSRIDTVSELLERAGLEDTLAQINQRLAEIEGIVGKVGDNGGPVDTSTQMGQFAHLRSQIERIAGQVATKTPSPISVAESALVIQGIAAQNDWLDDQLRQGAAAYIKSFCETAGKDHARALSIALGALILLIIQLLVGCVEWLEIATGG